MVIGYDDDDSIMMIHGENIVVKVTTKSLQFWTIWSCDQNYYVCVILFDTFNIFIDT